MSGENVEVVRRWLWAFENDADAFRDTLHPEIEWSPFEEDHKPSYGVAGAMRLRNVWLDTWDEHRFDVEEVIEAGDSVVASVHITARGKVSGVEVDVRLHGHFKVRQDKVVYLFEHEDRAAALEAVGLSDLAMSRENVELARRAYDAFNRRDQGAFLALMDDEVEAESRLVAMEGGYHGHDGLRRWWNDFLSVFPDYTIDVEELRDLGDVTLSRFRARGHGAASDTPIVDPAWQPIKWRDGKCVWWRVCSTEAEALEAAGLRE